MIRVPDGAVHLALFDISIWNIDCQYIDIDKLMLKNIDIDKKILSH